VDGISFLHRVMTFRPMPVIVVSSVSPRGSAAGVEALRLGAIDVIARPVEATGLESVAERVARRVREIREGPRVRVRRLSAEMAAVAPPVAQTAARHAGGLVLMGASTGGTHAIEAVLARLPADGPPVVIVQHMPAIFTRAFAERLDRVCLMKVIEAHGGEELQPGTAYVAAGDRHLLVEQGRHGLKTAIGRGPLIHSQRPSVDVLFHSAARLSGVPIVAALLTGMGRDGADGLLALRRAGAQTLAQDEQSSVAFGMPREAVARGGVCRVSTLFGMPAMILRAFDGLGPDGEALR
jgi:two-component system, chemotaxis family, protein-glutamate methylesterase/glutaminase